ncbi:uncharacterized protein [Venturia canescens]|uniref:uncharacterized protein n=1 Tax=Venturia canescens TaxID=32260 RepID=UPI001C9C65C4|nr:uncharacterized protein LOC122415275 [Venturia canescens]
MNPGIREPAPVVLHKSSAIGENEKNEERRLGDFDYSIRYIRLLLRILGIWHLVATKPAMKLEQHLSKIILASGSLSMITLMVPLCCHIIFRSVDRFEIIILLGPITYQAANIIMHYVLLFRSHTLGLCIRHMEDDWREIKDSNEDDIMKKHVHFSHLLSIACISFMYTSAIAYFLVMPFSSERSLNNEKNETVRPRAFPGSDFFFDAQANVLYELAFTMDFISALFHYTVSTSVCNLAVVLVSHACGQIQIVKWNLENFIHRVIEKHNDTTDTIVTEWIGIIVKKHVRLIEFAATIEEALREIFLVEVVASTLIICFVEYDIIIVSDQSKSDFLGTLTYVSLLIAFAFNLFLFCRFGEVLREQSEEIGKVAYMVDWYRLPGKTKLAFIMIINMAHTPCELTAGGMMELSIANFAKIMKTSFAYLNMLRKTG